MIGAFIYLCRYDPGINFLPPDHRASWILFPTAVDGGAHRVAPLDTIFRREVTLGQAPHKSVLRVRAAKQFQLKINDLLISFEPRRDWKNIVTLDIDHALMAGQNTIEATVVNDDGPPALWLSLETDELRIATDRSWIASMTGSAWRSAELARLARTPGRGNAVESSERMPVALARAWPLWLLFALAGLIVCAGTRLALEKKWLTIDRLPLVSVTTITVFWLLFYIHNAPILPLAVGFDVEAHLNYIKYLQLHHAMPPPTEGIEWHQAPLYYFISAILLSLFHLSPADTSAALILRGITMLSGIGQYLVVFATLRLMFAGRPLLQLVGTGLVAFLPMQLYLSHYPTNETLAGLLISASLYLTLRLVLKTTCNWWLYILLGLLLGAALLTKVTAVLLLPCIAVTLALGFSGELWPIRLAKIGTVFAIATMSCSWHYIRIASYGSSLIGSSNPVPGLFWWQDDGYRTIGYWFRLGESLLRPFYSVTYSFLDGLYSTMWGDGLCAGVPELSMRPPWNYQLMCAGYLLSLLPAALIIAGAGRALLKLLRTPRPGILLLAGLGLTMLLALIYYNLKVPCYSSTKAFYAIGASAPLAYFTVLGWQMITGGRKSLQFGLGLLLLVWAMNSYASLWIYDDAARYTNQAIHDSLDGNQGEAVVDARKAVGLAPRNAKARVVLATSLDATGQLDEAMREAQRAVEFAPSSSASHTELALLLVKQNEIEQAISEARTAVALGPEDVHAHIVYLLALLNSNEDFVDAGREALAISPYSSELHHLLGNALTRSGDLVGAFQQIGYAVLLKPDWEQAASDLHALLVKIVQSSAPSDLLHRAASSVPNSAAALDELAWVFATHPSENLRDGPAAVRLAARASMLERGTNPAALAILAAAYAENGDSAQAISTTRESLSVAHAKDDSKTISLAETILRLLQSNAPIRDNSLGR